MTIHEAIPKVMADVGAIGKGQTNKQQGFKYRGIDDVMNALQPVLTKHGVFIVPEIISQVREERQSKGGSNLIYSVCTIKYTFFSADGTSISATVIGEGMDSGDKATNKAMAIAMKYVLFQVFCIPTEEMKDPDGDTPPESKPKEHTQSEAQPPSSPAVRNQPDQKPTCGNCGREIKGIKLRDGNLITSAEILDLSKGLPKPLCYKCLKESENAG